MEKGGAGCLVGRRRRRRVARHDAVGRLADAVGARGVCRDVCIACVVVVCNVVVCVVAAVVTTGDEEIVAPTGRI